MPVRDYWTGPPRINRSGGKRSGARQRRKERGRSAPGEVLSAPAAPRTETPTAPSHGQARASSPAVALSSPKPAARHIGRDYSYVFGELRRIAIVVGIVLAGLVVATVALR